MKNTIKSNLDFKFGKSAQRITMQSFCMLVRPKLHEAPQFGLIVSKKIFPTAVARNRAKRLLRAWLSEAKMPKNHDILLIAQENILEQNNGVEQMKAAIAKISGAI